MDQMTLTVDSQLVTQIGFLGVVAFGFWYQHRLHKDQSEALGRARFAEGQMDIIKNRETRHLTATKTTGFWIFRRAEEKRLFLDYIHGNLVNVVGDTKELSLFPELTEGQKKTIEKIAAVTETAAKAGAKALLQ